MTPGAADPSARRVRPCTVPCAAPRSVHRRSAPRGRTLRVGNARGSAAPLPPPLPRPSAAPGGRPQPAPDSRRPRRRLLRLPRRRVGARPAGSTTPRSRRVDSGAATPWCRRPPPPALALSPPENPIAGLIPYPGAHSWLPAAFYTATPTPGPCPFLQVSPPHPLLSPTPRHPVLAPVQEDPGITKGACEVTSLSSSLPSPFLCSFLSPPCVPLRLWP